MDIHLMFKIVKYFSILLFTLFRKVFGLLWFWVAVWFRGYARNVVYNYKLQNGLWLKRLYEREIVPTTNGYTLSDEGFIYYREGISKLEYLFVYWFLWGWIDDDSNYDTTDKGYIENILSGENTSYVGNLFKGSLIKGLGKLENDKFGNTFDLGDIRKALPVLYFLPALVWLIRNTAYNFKYDQYEQTEQDFYFELFGYCFGWKPEDTVQGKDNYTLVFMEKV